MAMITGKRRENTYRDTVPMMNVIITVAVVAVASEMELPLMMTTVAMTRIFMTMTRGCPEEDNGAEVSLARRQVEVEGGVQAAEGGEAVTIITTAIDRDHQSSTIGHPQCHHHHRHTVDIKSLLMTMTLGMMVVE